MRSESRGGPGSAWAIAFFVAVAVTSIAYLYLPAETENTVYNVVALTTAGVMFVGIALYRPEPRSSLLLLATGILMTAIGDILYGISQPVPSPADIVYLAAYPVMGIALVGLDKGQHHSGKRLLVEPSIIALEAGMLVMVLLLVLSDGSGTEGVLTRAVSFGYPVMDAILLGLFVRVIRQEGHVTTAFKLLGAALILTLVADIGWVLLDYGTSYVIGDQLDVIWLIAYGCFGAAFLHPSIRTGEPATRGLPRGTVSYPRKTSRAETHG